MANRQTSNWRILKSLLFEISQFDIQGFIIPQFSPSGKLRKAK